jgi:uncharacterized protein
VKFFWPILAALGCFSALAAEVIPPRPAQYFNDYAHVVSAPVVGQLNQTLEDFERQTSEQIVVAVFPKMQSDSSIEDYTVRVARAWQVGQLKQNNGAVLFVFVEDHKMFLQVGYGLEGVLPDALCKRIITEQISPHFKSGDFDAGLAAGVQSIIAATKGEYKGTGRTVADRIRNREGNWPVSGLAILIIIIVLFLRIRSRGYSAWMIGSGGFSGGGWGGGGSSGSGGFSGGGGSFGGGGAGGSW